MATSWEKGDFQPASPERCAELMNKLGYDDAQIEQLILFTGVPSTDPETLILCHKVFVSQLIPLL